MKIIDNIAHFTSDQITEKLAFDQVVAAKKAQSTPTNEGSAPQKTALYAQPAASPTPTPRPGADVSLMHILMNDPEFKKLDPATQKLVLDHVNYRSASYNDTLEGVMKLVTSKGYNDVGVSQRAAILDAFAYSSDKGYVDRLLNLVNDEGFIALNDGNKEISLLKAYGSNPDFASKIDQLMASKGYNDVGGLERAAILDAFAAHSNDNDFLNRLYNLVNDKGFIALDDGNKEIDLINAYSSDSAVATSVDKLITAPHTNDAFNGMLKLMTSKGYNDVGSLQRAAILDAFAAHSTDKGYVDRLLNLVNDEGFIALDDGEKEINLLKAYSSNPDFASDIDKLMASKGYNDVGGLQRVEMLDAMVRHSSDKGYVDRLLKLVNDEGFIALNDGNKEISLVKAYSRYPAFAVNVDKLMASKGYQDAGGQTRAAMLDALQSHANMFAFAPWLSHKGFTDRLYKVVNSNGFIALNDPVKETALVKAYGKSSSFATNFDEVMATSKDLKFDEFMMLDPEKQPRLDGTKMLVWNGEDEPMIFQAKKTSDHNYQVTLNGSQSFDVKFDPTPKFPEEAYVLGLADWYSEQSPRTRGGLKTVQFNGEDSDGALARGGNGTITFYGGTKNYDKGIFEHEMGHIAATLLDNQQPTDFVPPGWDDAVKKDGGDAVNGISDYAKDVYSKKGNYMAEDFADSWRAYSSARDDPTTLAEFEKIPEMVDLLDGYGDKALAEDYMNCGQPDLAAAGRSWALGRGYTIGTSAGSNRAGWGSE